MADTSHLSSNSRRPCQRSGRKLFSGFSLDFPRWTCSFLSVSHAVVSSKKPGAYVLFPAGGGRFYLPGRILPKKLYCRKEKSGLYPPFQHPAPKSYGSLLHHFLYCRRAGTPQLSFRKYLQTCQTVVFFCYLVSLRYSYSKRGNFMKPFFFSLSSPRRRYRHSAENPPHMQADGTFQAHPVQGMTYFLRYAYLLLIPFLRQALSSPETLLQQIYSSLSNLLLGALIMLFIYLRWRCTYISATSSLLVYESGIFLRSRVNLPLSLIDAASQEGFFGLYRFSIGACAQTQPSSALRRRTKKGADLTFFLSKNNLRALWKRILPFSSRHPIYRARYWTIGGMALFNSNLISGLLLLAPFFRQIGVILGQELAVEIYERFDFRLYLISLGIPPAAAGLAWIFLAGWLLALFVQWTKYAGFSIFTDQDFLHVESGALYRYRRAYRKKQIHAVTARQTLPMKLLGFYAAYLHTARFSKKEKRAWILPMVRKNTWMRFAASLLSNSGKTCEASLNRKLYAFVPPERSLFSYLWPPLTLLLGLVGLSLFLSLSKGSATLSFLMLFPVFLSSWHLISCVLEFQSTFLRWRGTHLILCYRKGLSLLTTVTSTEEIQMFLCTQTVFQRRKGVCHLTLWLKGDISYKMKLRHFPINTAKEFPKSAGSLPLSSS